MCVRRVIYSEFSLDGIICKIREGSKIVLSTEEILQLIYSLIWLLAGVGIFIVGMNFMGDALEKSAGSGMKRLLEKISNNRISGVGIGAGVTAIIQSSSATSVMVIGLVNAGVMTLMQATPIIMGATSEPYQVLQSCRRLL